MENSTLILKNHPSIVLHKDISDICHPLFQKQLFCIMNFIRLHNNGHVSYLCDNLFWIKYYLLNGYPSLGAFEKNNDFHLQEYVLWDALHDDDPIVIYSRQMFNIKHGITIIRKSNNGWDFFNFGVSEESRNVLNRLLIERESLNHFINEFYDKAKKLIKIAEKQAFDLNDFNALKLNKCIEKKLYLGPQYDYAYLTAKEITCLKYLLQGLSIPKIADIKNLSVRTIEKHIENIKQKFHCTTQFELGYLAAKLEIDLL